MQKTFDIYHTRLNRRTTIIKTAIDPFNPMNIILDFLYEPPTNYFRRSEDIVFGIYIDRVFIMDFRERKVKAQVQDLDVNQQIEIFAHPHEGFQFIRNRLQPGNKIRIVFRARDPDIKDIDRHDIYWDNATGTYLTKKMGIVDPLTGDIEGAKLFEGTII